MPNGLTFTKLLKPVFFALRRQIQQIMGYLGGSFLMGDIFSKCKEELLPSVGLFSKLIFLIHLRFCPARKLNFGFMINSRKMTICLSGTKEEGILRVFMVAKTPYILKIRGLARTIGNVKQHYHAFSMGDYIFRSHPK